MDFDTLEDADDPESLLIFFLSASTLSDILQHTLRFEASMGIQTVTPSDIMFMIICGENHHPIMLRGQVWHACATAFRVSGARRMNIWKDFKGETGAR